MRKFKVTKEFPGAKVGDVLEWNFAADGYLINGPRNGPTENGSTLIMQPEFLKGFGEEIKEPEEFWFLNKYGKPVRGSEYDVLVPVEFRFPTKEHAQAFADGMKDMNIWNLFQSVVQMRELKNNFSSLALFVDALNSRRSND